MQYLNDDMDELIRRASENYPLDTSGANWDKVKNAMQQPVVLKKRNYRWIWLAPLAILWISNTFIAYREGFGDGKASNSITHDSFNSENRQSQSSSAPTITLRKQDHSTQVQLIDQRPVLIPATRELIFKKVAGPAITKSKFDIKSIPDNVRNTQSQNMEISDLYLRPLAEPIINPHNYLPVTVSPLSINRSTLILLKSDENTAQQKRKSKSSKSLYGAVVVGSDMNTVKMQPLSKPGITAGIKLGFQLSHWSLESGLLYDRKSYSSDGKYFDYKLYPNTKINSVSGTCNMFELPIDVRYAFKPSDKHTFYISGGLSSYLMKKENYTYDYDWYGQSYYSNHTYMNSSNNFFSVINISAGYQFKIGHNSSMRFEPYGKLPVKGVGIGKLPLTSFGLNLIVSKDFLHN